jgi:hypothetical protein
MVRDEGAAVGAAALVAVLAEDQVLRLRAGRERGNPSHENMGGDVAVACGQRLEGTRVVDLVGRQGSKQQLAIRSKTAAAFATNATQLAFFIGRASG